VNRGEVWYELPDAGRRPGLILTRQAAIPVLNAVLVAPATRTIRGIEEQTRHGQRVVVVWGALRRTSMRAAPRPRHAWAHSAASTSQGLANGIDEVRAGTRWSGSPPHQWRLLGYQPEEVAKR